MKRIFSKTTSSIFKGNLITGTLVAIHIASFAPISSAEEAWDGLRERFALYEYYQGNYFSALSQLQVLKSKTTIDGLPGSAELLEGGVSLSFGLEIRAESIFQSLLQNPREDSTDDVNISVSPEVHSIAWYFLGKLQYQQGDYSAAKSSFNQITEGLGRDRLEEIRYLQTNIALKENKLSEARVFSRNIPDKSTWRFYANYNVATTAFSNEENNPAQGTVELKPLLDYLGSNPELILLRERALISQGYSLLKQNNPVEAMHHLGRVEKDSLFHSQAMLGYGWGAAQQENYLLALSPWLTLSEGNILDPNVREAIVAVPFAYEKLNRPVSALEAYNSAIQRFNAEIEALSTLSSYIQSSSITTLLNLSSEYTDKPLEELEARALSTIGESLLKREYWQGDKTLSAIQPLLEKNAIQNAISDYLNLLRLKQYLSHWQQRLLTYKELITQRELARKDKEQQIIKLDTGTKLEELKKQKASLLNKLVEIEAAGTGTEFLQGDNLEFMEMVQSAQSNLNILEKSVNSGLSDNDEIPIEQYKNDLARYKGILLWRASEGFSDAFWQHKALLLQVDREIQRLEENSKRVNKALDESPDILPYQQRVDKLDNRISATNKAIKDQLAKIENQLKVQFVDELNQNINKITYYLGYARLGAARLYDKSAGELRPGSQDTPMLDGKNQSDTSPAITTSTVTDGISRKEL